MSESDTSEDVGIQRAQSRFERSTAEKIKDRTFPLAVRGYDRHAVESFLEEVAGLVGELEGRQSRETVVQRALDEVGVETAGILQRAHQTADEIAARSRSQAEGRIQRAEGEAEILRRQAEEYSEKVVVDTQLLWEERQRLLEDIRQLADEVLATADEAAERVTLPDGLTEEPPADEPLPEGAVAADPVDPPTAEVELDLLPGGASGREGEAGEQVAGGVGSNGVVEVPGEAPRDLHAAGEEPTETHADDPQAGDAQAENARLSRE